MPRRAIATARAPSLRCRTTARAPSPLLRPHARLTSFGGCVATGGTRFIASAPVPPLGRNKCDPPAAHCHLHFYTSTRPFLRRRGNVATMPHDGEGAVATGATACSAHFVRGICRCGHRCCGEAGGVACGDGALAVAGGMAAARLLLRMMPVMVYYAAKGDEHD